ncbi:MAG: hypothetical protein Q8P05_01665 [Candidatus Diapherotrites archaeon]|nr:hypothetical protein [Candidatus Diapherotrites archaeon]MDZ4256363.1 hypothetical protein [archaeon]
MEKILIRLDGKPEKVLHDLLEKGIYKTKTEAIRAGIMQLQWKENFTAEWMKLQQAAQKNKRSIKEIQDALSNLDK